VGDFDVTADTNGHGPDIGGDFEEHRSRENDGVESAEKARDIAGIGERAEVGGTARRRGSRLR